MSNSAYASFALRLSAAIALLTGCAGLEPRIAIPSQPDLGTSWTSPDAKSIKALLYVSDIQTYDVFVYDYRKGTLVGKLTGIEGPLGECVDTKGDVWITSTANDSVVEYAHGASRPLRTLTTDSQPVGCSVDPTTGNLAVAGFSGIDVFEHARWKRHAYGSSYCYPLWSPGYDDRGNLYVVGLLYGSLRVLTGYSDPLACELPRGGTALRPVHFNGFLLDYPGSIMWDGKHLALTDQNYKGSNATGFYRVKEGADGNLTAVGERFLPTIAAAPALVFRNHLSSGTPSSVATSNADTMDPARRSTIGHIPRAELRSHPCNRRRSNRKARR